MSDFAQDWLEQREPVDLAARNARVRDACVRHFAGRDRLSICDLGAGTGSSLRALAEHLPPRQHWTLLDHDPAHLEAARAALGRWAGGAKEAPGGLVLQHGGREIIVRTQVCDLAQEGAAHAADADLITASALFDLASEPWIGRLVAELAARRTALYARLTFDGRIAFEPDHPLDDAMVGAFLVHQRGDKGFGLAAGAQAHGMLLRHLQSAGYRVEEGPSPWHLDATTSGITAQFVAGLVAAAGETGRIGPAELDTWRRDRHAAMQAGRLAVAVGHGDLFAWLP